MPADPKTTAAGLEALDRYFGITDSLAANGCDHGIKPAKYCPNANCEARIAHLAWESINNANAN